jgi:ankyrin repeat protein
VKEGHGKIVEILLNKKEKRKELLSAKTNLGDSLVHLAAKHGDLSIAHFLIREGAEVDSKSNDGESPLNIAQKEGNVQMANILIATKNIQGKESLTTSPLYGIIVNRFQTLAERIISRRGTREKLEESEVVQGIYYHITTTSSAKQPTRSQKMLQV